MTPSRDLTRTTPRVVEIERIVLDVPFRERVHDWNMLHVRQYRIVEVLILRTEDPEIVGCGETLPHYTWGRVSE